MEIHKGRAMRNKSANRRRPPRKLVLIVDPNRPAAERRIELLRREGYEVDYAGSENQMDSFIRHHRYDLVLLAFSSRTDPEKAATMCRKLELTTPRSIVGWLASDLTLIPPGFCPTVVRETREPDSFIKRINCLVASGQKCRVTCVSSEQSESGSGVEADRRGGILRPIVRTLIRTLPPARTKSATTTAPRPKTNRRDF